MTIWSDERLEQLLRDTFRDHEDLADPDRAVNLAGSPDRRRRWPAVVAAAAAVAVLAGGTAYLVGDGPDRSSPGGPAGSSTAASPSPTPPTGTTDQNVLATHARSTWLLHAVPMPPGSRETSESPIPEFRERNFGMGPSDAEFTLSTWWVVPTSGADFTAWLSTHAPDGLDYLDGGAGSYSVGDGQMAQQEQVDAASTDASTAGHVVFSFLPYGDGLAVRVDTFIGARFARTVFVPEGVTEVRVRRTEVPNLGPRGGYPDPSEVRITDPADIAALVDLVNYLPGAMTVPFVHSCPAQLSTLRYQVVFVAPDTTAVLTVDGLGCEPAAALEVNRVLTEPTLDPGPDLADELDAYLE